MKAKQLFLSALAVGLILPAVAGTVNAADSTPTNVPVTYDNRNIIPDPDRPQYAEWGVSIPTAIKFTDSTTVVDTSLELVHLNGSTTFVDKNIDVSVQSTNSFDLKLNGTDDTYKVPYTLMYENQPVTKDNNAHSVATLNGGGSTVVTFKEGKAVLGEVKVSKRGEYSDTLTYVVSTQ